MTLFKANQRFFDVQNEPHEILSSIEGYDDMPLLSLKMAVENLERIITKVTENANTSKERSISPAHGLSQDESASICLYTMDGKVNDKSLCHQLNAALRSKDRSELLPYLMYLKLFLTALWKLKSLRKTVWRGVKADLGAQYPVGKSFVWWGFSSCVDSLDDIQSDRLLGTRGIRTIFKIECQTGKAISKHSYYDDIEEILLLPGIQLEVLSQNRPSTDVCIIHLREIESSVSYLQSPLTSSNLNNSMQRYYHDKPYSAPLSSTRSMSHLANTQRSRSLCVSSSLLPQEDTKILKKATKFHEKKVLKEFINQERKKESIRFPKELLDCDDMQMLSQELTTNKYWKAMYLWENYLNEKHVSILMHGLKLNTTMKCLSLDCNFLNDEGASILAGILKSNTSLGTVYLNKNHIGDIGAQDLADMLHTNKTLTHLELSSNSIGDDGISVISEALKFNKSLRTLHLNDNDFTEIGAKHLADMLLVNKTLKELQISGNPIGDSGVNMIVDALKKNTTLESLDIGETKITIECMQEIGKMLEMNCTLKSLDLNHNHLEDDALMMIIPSLMKNSALTSLDLSMNNLTETSANELACLLEESQTTLTTLSLSHNPLGDSGVSNIAAALINNRTLIKLILESVKITIEGVSELAHMLSLNETLHCLDLNSNEISDDSINLLVDGLQNNRTLQNLYLNNCNLTDECVSAIIELIKQSRTLNYIELVKNHLTEHGKKDITQAASLKQCFSVYLDFSFQRVH
ncbi:unnamed protein product [Rotaria magnacalcarata]|uniref:NAD(P)(+)--arginine ADP-ribosyltransferase n=3 Tax=Rotaria magnacalcarata TaxID=392030 RepID=A0A815HCH8_9BILA|nr:unnamed protein product [Rotaria magnacalcarata]CAF2141303.1 unnamed protein product [Rotaria magnacalcarata]CAF4165004.1 unnamed protein product [Rotaria magnacalcarata]